MSFYTNLYRFKNNIYYRGYSDNGDRVIRKEHFKPTFYVNTRQPSKFKSLDGVNVAPVSFESMYQANQWKKENENTSGRNVYGNTRFISQYAMEKFPGEIKFDRKMINVGTFDIETDYDDGFPYPELADHTILSITYKSSKFSTYHVWGYGEFDTKTALISDVRYTRCNSEEELLTKFLNFWSHPDIIPDVITGWNTRFFDIPYIINRTAKVLGIEVLPKFSPYGLQLGEPRKINSRGRTSDVYEIPGIQTLDYMELFQKFGYTYGPQESYALNHIAHVVLGEKKLSYEESGSLKNLYKDDHQKYIDYNMKDVQLVDRLEEKLGLITLAITMAYKGGVNYQDTFGVTAIWESIICKKLYQSKIIPSIKQKEDPYIPVGAKNKHNPDANTRASGSFYAIAGGYVKEPNPGKYEWVVSFDLNSLYPNIIVQNNMSPETYLYQTPEDNCTMAGLEGYETFYSKSKQGVLPQIIKEFYDERVSIKKQMIAAKNEIEKGYTFDLDKEISNLDNRQMTIKILLNSLYGALANKHFLYFAQGIAESITLTGQRAIKWAENTMNRELQSILKTKDDYVVAIDTDSLYVNFGPLVKKLNPNNPVLFLDKICREHFEPAIKKDYDKFYKMLNSYENRMVMAREAISDVGIWTAKKRYILNVHNNEGVQYKEPQLKMMGIEAIKSSTPQVVRDKFKEVFKLIVSGTEEETQEVIAQFKEEFKRLSPEEISFPRTCNISGERPRVQKDANGDTIIDLQTGKSVKAYEDVNWSDRTTIFKKSCPIHVRGALLFNYYVKRYKLQNKYEIIGNGSKIKYCYIKKPNIVKSHVISFQDVLPKELRLHDRINYDLQFTKAFLEPLNLILNPIGWKAEKKKDIQTLEDFLV